MTKEHGTKSSSDDELFPAKRYPVALMVRDAIEMPETFNALVKHFQLYVANLSRIKAFYFSEDAQQAAWIRVWRKMAKADLLRPETVESYIKAVVISAIKDEVRAQLRGTRMLWDAKDCGVLPDKITKSTIYELEKELDEVLTQYLNHIRREGDWSDAHKNIALKRGISTARATTLFHRSVKSFMQQEAEKQNGGLGHHFGGKTPAGPEGP